MADRPTYYRQPGTQTGRKTYYQPASSHQGRQTYYGHASTGPHHSHGPFGFIGNTAKDVEEMATGALPGAVNLVRHPVESAKGLWQVEKHNYSPLVHGHFRQFAEQVYEHPVGYALDAATLAAALGTFGLASPEAVAARAALETGETTKGIQLSNAARLAGQELNSRGEQVGRTVVKRVSRNPVIRARQKAVDRMLKRLPAETKLVGEHSRYGRAVRRQTYHEARALRVLGYPFEKAFHRLSKTERIAWSYHHDAMHPSEGAAFFRREHPNVDTDPNLAVVRAAIKQAENPKVIAAYEHPSPKLQAAIDEGRKLSAAREQWRRDHPRHVDDPEWGPYDIQTFDEQAFAERPFLHLRLARGAQFEHVAGETKALFDARRYVTRVQKLHDRALLRVKGEQKDLLTKLAAKFGARDVVRPRTIEEAQARVAVIDKQFNSLVDQYAKSLGHPHYEFGTREQKAETQRRNISNAKYRLQQSGKTKSGKLSGASGAKVDRLLPTLKEEARQHAERVILEAMKTSEDPTMLRVKDVLAERDELAQKIGLQQEQFGASAEDFGQVTEHVPATEEAGTIGNLVVRPGRVLHPRGDMRAQHLGAVLSEAKTRVESLEARAFNKHGHVPAPGQREAMVLRGGPSIEELKAEGRNPFYVPDIQKQARPRTSAAAGLGRGLPQTEGALKHNIGRIFENGLLYRDPEALHIGHLRQVRAQLGQSIHDALVANGIQVSADELVPSGYYFIRADAKAKIGHLQQVAGEALDSLKDFREPIDFITKVRDEAANVDGHYVVVPKTFADQLTGEFRRSESALRAIWEQPTKIWRAMVLGLRPGFFTNNIVGNYLLYALRHHGWASVKAWVSFLKEIGARKALKELGGDNTFRALAMKHIPEVFYGTFGRSQFEDLPAVGKLGRFRHGVGPATVTAAEETPRLMIARETVIKEARRLKTKIPKQTVEFNKLADELLSHPEVAERAVTEANRTLGDYLHYSPVESSIRNIIPFYGWTRAITKIALQTTLDTPGYADLVAKLGQLAIQENQSKYGPLPDYLMGMIPLSGIKQDGSVYALTTKGLNPASTIADVASGLKGVATGKPGEGATAVSKLGPNPFLQALYEWASGKSMRFGSDVHPTFLPGAAGYMIGSVGEQLPMFSLGRTFAGHPRPSKVYANNKSRPAALGGFLGFPVKRINLPAAQKTANVLPKR